METALADTADLRVWDLPVRAHALAAGYRDRGVLVERRHQRARIPLPMPAMPVPVDRAAAPLLGPWSGPRPRALSILCAVPRPFWIMRPRLHRRDTPHSHGHNALGAISIVLMLGLVLAVVTFGPVRGRCRRALFRPLSLYVSFKQGRQLAHLH